jgi:hypothetical protein
LNVAPQWILFKRRNTAASWVVYHVSVGNTAVLVLDSTVVPITNSIYFNNTSPSSSVFTVGTAGNLNGSSDTYVAYCWAPVAGFSAFGSYTGNGSADGPFVYTGFKPKFVMTKGTNIDSSWAIWDAGRNTYNATNNVLRPQISNAEISPYNIDFLSNGFKFRDTDATWNNSGSSYIYMAFAENPLKYALAR